MKEKLLNNIWLKLLALVLAILAWMVIVNVSDPSTRVTVSGVKVELVNTEVLIENEYIYEVIEGNVIEVSVRGPRTIVENLEAADFKATARVALMSDTAKIEVICVDESIAGDISITPKTEEVKLNLENMVSETFPVQAVLGGTPASGYFTDESQIATTPANIKVTGSQAVIDKIARVVVKCDVSGYSQSIQTTMTPVLLDAYGKEIDKTNLLLSSDSLDTTITVLKTKRIAINFVTMGEPESGYKYAGYQASLTNVLIAGKEEDIDAIDALNIPADYLDVTNLNSNKTVVVPIQQFIPSNFMMIQGDTTATVELKIERLYTKTYYCATSEVKLLNLEDGYKAKITTPVSLPIVVSGLIDDIDGVTSQNIVTSVNLEGLTQGTHVLKVKVDEPENCEVHGEYTVTVVITRN